MSEKRLNETERTLGDLSRLACDALQARVYGTLAEARFPEIRAAHSVVFRHIGRTGSRVSDLAERARMTKQSMAYLVEALVGGGYVTVRPDPTDGRAKMVWLTERGHKVSRTLVQLSGQVEAEFATLLPPGRFALLRELLNELAIALQRSAG